MKISPNSNNGTTKKIGTFFSNMFLYYLHKLIEIIQQMEAQNIQSALVLKLLKDEKICFNLNIIK